MLYTSCIISLQQLLQSFYALYSLKFPSLSELIFSYPPLILHYCCHPISLPKDHYVFQIYSLICSTRPVLLLFNSLYKVSMHIYSLKFTALSFTRPVLFFFNRHYFSIYCYCLKFIALSKLIFRNPRLGIYIIRTVSWKNCLTPHFTLQDGPPRSLILVNNIALLSIYKKKR